MSTAERPSKKDAFIALLQKGWVSLHLDARRADVMVPPAFAGNAHLVLEYGYDMPVPIHDLEVTDAGISATLSFFREPCHTSIPWGAVYIVASADGSGIIYFEDVPKEVSLMTAPAEALTTTKMGDEDAPAADQLESPPSRPHLRSVPAEDAANRDADPPTAMPTAAEASPFDDRASAKPRKRPALRLVK